MNKVLIIFAHPNPASLNAEILRTVQKSLSGERVETIDLYADKFDPVLPLAELYTIGNKKISAQVQKYQQQVAAAEWLIFIYPTWWFDLPAILKGFIDRVFTAGFAFKFEKGRGMPQQLLRGKKAILIQTYSSPRVGAWLFPDAGWRNFRRSILNFCGIRVVARFPIFGVRSLQPPSEKTAQQLEKISIKLPKLIK